MTETLVQWFVETLGGSAAKEVVIFVISMIPILELRGGLLAAGPAFLDVEMWRAIPICIVGNLIPVPFILLLITKIFSWLKGTKLFRPMVEKMERKAMSKKDQIEKYEFWGLLFFVGDSPAGDRGLDGSLAAAFLGMRLKKAMPAVVLGVLTAGCIMLGLTHMGINLFSGAI